MIQITDQALVQIKNRLNELDRGELLLSIRILGRGPGGFMYTLQFIEPEQRIAGDLLLQEDGLKVVIDPSSAPYMEGAVLDFTVEDGREGFKFENPNPLWFDPTALAVQEVIDNQINPGVSMHGGMVVLTEVKDGVAYILMGGGCQGCGLANVTLKEGVEKAILETVPEIKSVVDITQHAQGANPYYKPSQAGESPYQE